MSMPDISTYLGLFHLHDVGLTVSDAVIDVVYVSSQRLNLFSEREDGSVGIRVLARDLILLSHNLLLAPGQLFTLLWTTN